MTQTTTRYTVTRKTDGMGCTYPTPLVEYAGEDVAEAQRIASAHGGEVIDHQDRQGWALGIGWYDVADYLNQIEA